MAEGPRRRQQEVGPYRLCPKLEKSRRQRSGAWLRTRIPGEVDVRSPAEEVQRHSPVDGLY